MGDDAVQNKVLLDLIGDCLDRLAEVPRPSVEGILSHDGAEEVASNMKQLLKQLGRAERTIHALLSACHSLPRPSRRRPRGD